MIGFADQVPPAILLRWLDVIEISPLRGSLSETLPLLRKLCTLCKQLFVHEFPLPAPSSQNAGTDVIRAVASTCLSLLRHVNPSRVSNFRVVRRPTTLNEILEATETEAKECDSEAQSVTRDLGMLLVSLNLAQLQSRGDKQDETLEVIRSLRLPIFHEWAQDKQSIGFGFKPSQAPTKGALLDSHTLFNMIQFDILENTHWGDELVDQLFALCHHIPGSVSRNTPEWWRAIEILETIAYCSGIDPPGELQRIRDLRASPASRMIQALIALSDVMASESTSLIISMGMGQHILRIFRVSLQSDKTEDLEDQVTRIGDPLLKWFANLLLGWEYSPDVFEDSSDPKWENGAWHIAISCWMQLLPPSRWSHDSHQLLFQLSQRDNQVILRTFHGCLREHIPMSKDTKEPLSEDLQGLLRVALPFFTDSQDLLQDSLIIIASVLSSYDCIDHFFDCGGLEWLCSMKRQYQPQETPDDSLEVTPVGPLQLFKDYIVNYIFRRDLIIEILRSPFIVDPTPDEDIHVLITITWEMLKVVSPIRRGEKFPAAATRCAEILNQELVIWSTRESSWSVSREIYETLGISYFEDWCRFVQDLIGNLRRDSSSITELGSAKMGLTASVNLWPVDD
ncbi:hypothetical protein FRC17_007852 [Serendipita sp. 399]|nr:hypothetical protein FRC17_007852 [Serendipita sp. 399]